ncbi:putative Nitronate monooxygenase [Tricladium varicosporioides]|nr:putative Nitronate monooxygenase [Hymenoscyphus varicosporioides]
MAPSPKQQYPWTATPLIANAAMAGFAGPSLAVAVSKAGGIGFIGALPAKDTSLLDSQLTTAKLSLASTYPDFQTSGPGLMPIGVGYLLFASKLDDAVEIVKKHKPAVVWFACPKVNKDFETWTKAVRGASEKSKIWIQVASVSVALEVAKSCSPDILIMQGSDAGGHGPCPGAGIVSLVPETRDALNEAGLGEVGIFAAGGIVDGRGAAAALACGANGVVMGTRFLASTEVDVPAEDYRTVVLSAKDGGVSTARATVFDELAGKSFWPGQYDGRAVAGASYRDSVGGVEIQVIRKRYAEAVKESHKGFGGEERAPVWAGSGVGLVNEVKGAGEIVQEVRDTAKVCLEKAAKSYCDASSIMP